VPGWGKDHPLYDALLPVPGRPVLLFALGRRGAQKTASGVVAVDLRGRGETPVSGLTFQPWVLFQDRGIQVSADGRLVLARHQNGLQICEWETNRRLLELTGSTNSFGGAWFTPDAKRCLVLRSPHGAVPPGGGSEKLAATFELYDIAAKRMIAECPPDDFDLTGVSAVAFSQDGKTVAIADRLAAVKLFDFESAFHVPPLPPVKPTWETDPLR
jgi:hypothetical protein